MASFWICSKCGKHAGLITAVVHKGPALCSKCRAKQKKKESKFDWVFLSRLEDKLKRKKLKIEPKTSLP